MPAAPAAADDCDPDTLTRGTFDHETGVFTAGTGTDYRIECADAADDGDSVVTLEIEDVPETFDDLVIHLGGGDPFYEDDAGGVRYVITSDDTIETTGRGEDGLFFLDNDDEDGDVWAESHATVITRGDGSRGLFAIAGGDADATAINRGTIDTWGGVSVRGGEESSSYGVLAYTPEDGDAVAGNVGDIETRGAGAVAIVAVAGGNGAAAATNSGSVTVRGDPFEATIGNVGQPNWATGVEAYSERGDATAENAADGAILATGRGANGVVAGSGGFYGTTGDGDAVAVNRGTVTVSGDASEVMDPDNTAWFGQVGNSEGVYAWTEGTGQAFASNEAGGRIETTGKGSLGAGAWAGGGGEARVENRGEIVTRGDKYVSATGEEARSYGLLASSPREGDAIALNDVGGAVETHGTRAFAVFAESFDGTARATNRGEVLTHSTAFDEENPFALPAIGVLSFSANGDALVVNEAAGSVATKGRGALGLLAETDNAGADAVNRGGVTTEGRGAHAVLAHASHGGSEGNPNVVSALNADGGRIEAKGDQAGGLSAAIDVADRGSSFGSARAENADAFSPATARPTFRLRARGKCRKRPSSNSIINLSAPRARKMPARSRPRAGPCSTKTPQAR